MDLDRIPKYIVSNQMYKIVYFPAFIIIFIRERVQGCGTVNINIFTNTVVL